MTEPRDNPNAAEGGETDKPFEDLLGRLEEVVLELEGGELRLERSLVLFEEGVGLSREASRRLDVAEQRIEELLATGETKPIEED